MGDINGALHKIMPELFSANSCSEWESYQYVDLGAFVLSI
jgi:hypothetical protein